MSSSGARFTINTAPSSPRGFSATSAATLTLTLEQNPAVDVTQVVFSVVATNPGATVPTFSPGPSPSSINGSVSLILPAGAGSYIIRCQTNQGQPVTTATGPDYTVNTYDRGVFVPTANLALRLIVFGESTEFSTDAWAGSIDKLITAIDLGGGGLVQTVTPPLVLAAGNLSITDATDSNDGIQSHTDKAAWDAQEATFVAASGTVTYASGANVTWTQSVLPGTGGANAPTWFWHGAAGQQATGGANNSNGSSLFMTAGLAGTGGSGAPGAQGNIVFEAGGITVTFSPNGLSAPQINVGGATPPSGAAQIAVNVGGSPATLIAAYNGSTLDYTVLGFNGSGTFSVGSSGSGSNLNLFGSVAGCSIGLTGNIALNASAANQSISLNGNKLGFYTATPVGQANAPGVLGAQDVGAVPSQTSVNAAINNCVSKINAIMSVLSQAEGGVGITT